MTARADDKVMVHDSLLQAIQQGAVRPLPRYTAPPQALAESQRYGVDSAPSSAQCTTRLSLSITAHRRVVEGAGKVLLSMKSEQSAKATSLLDPSRSCLVVGGPASRAVSVSEWMLSSGARDVSVALAGRAAGSGWLARRLGLLAAHYGASVRALPAADPQQLVKVSPPRQTLVCTEHRVLELQPD